MSTQGFLSVEKQTFEFMVEAIPVEAVATYIHLAHTGHKDEVYVPDFIRYDQHSQTRRFELKITVLHEDAESITAPFKSFRGWEYAVVVEYLRAFGRLPSDYSDGKIFFGGVISDSIVYAPGFHAGVRAHAKGRTVCSAFGVGIELQVEALLKAGCSSSQFELRRTLFDAPIRDFHTPTRGANLYDFSEIKGHRRAKRALEIAAAGQHSLMFLPEHLGLGSVMLARRLSTILPPPTPECLDMRSFSSGSLLQYSLPSFRAPHYTASERGMYGDRNTLGEVDLAQEGVILLDEIQEFRTIARKRIPFVRNTNVVAILNVENILDRCADSTIRVLRDVCPPFTICIGLWEEDMLDEGPVESSETIRARVIAARDFAKREDLQSAPDELTEYERDVARTIANLRASVTISDDDIIEARDICTGQFCRALLRFADDANNA